MLKLVCEDRPLTDSGVTGPTPRDLAQKQRL